MKTLLKTSFWKILQIFYENRNSPLHLREISRKTRLNESTISKHLNNLVKSGVLKEEKEANLRKFYINKSQVAHVFPMFDNEKLEALPLLRKDAIKLYINKLGNKPVLLIVFGSTAKGTFKKESDIDILEVKAKVDNEKTSEKYVEAQTGIKLQIFKVSELEFYSELKLKKDKVVQSALETGFPVFNQEYFYEVLYNE